MSEIQLHSCACCTKQIRPGLLMCPRHWRAVSRPLQREVLRSWKAYLRAEPKWRSRFLIDYERARYEAIASLQAQDSADSSPPPQAEGART